MDRILLCLAHMSGNEMKFVEEAFAGNWVVPLGPNVNGFEADLKRFVESAPDGSRMAWAEHHGKSILALDSGTAAIHLALIGCGVGPGDEVIVQSFTFCASANPVTYVGATPVFVDSEPDTWNMDPDLLDRCIADRIRVTGRKPKAIMAVYLYGMPAKIDELMAVAAKYDIPFIEDAAEALGSRYKGRVCGSMGNYGIFSFNGNKMITTSGGGALICPDEAERNRMMFYATQAREGYPYYHHCHIGYNYRLSNISAGIGRGQMTILDDHVRHHQHVAELYQQLLADVPGIEYHKAPSPDYDANYWLSTVTLDPGLNIVDQDKAYSVRVTGAVGGAAGAVHQAETLHTEYEPNANVEALRVWLDAHNIESRPTWKPMHLQPVFADAPSYVNGVSESIFRTGMCLPSGPMVTDDHVRYIVDCIKSAILVKDGELPAHHRD